MICGARARAPSLYLFPIGGNQEFLRGAESTMRLVGKV
jgi:hypothetical protein